MRQSLATGRKRGYRSNRSPLCSCWLNQRFCRNSSINISIDNRYYNRFVHPEDRYLPWITRAVFTIPTTLGIAHARVTLAMHRSPNLRPGCRIIATQHLDALTVSSAPYVSYLFLVPPSRWYERNCNRFNWPQVIRHYFPMVVVIGGDCAMTLAFHLLQKRCSIKISLLFISASGSNIALPLQYLGPLTVFQ